MNFFRTSLFLALGSLAFCSCTSPRTLNSRSSVSNVPAAKLVSEESARPYARKQINPANPAAQKSGKIRRVRTTSYSCAEKEKGGIYGNKNAIGSSLKYGKIRSAAADWSRMPLGTKFRIVGEPYIYVIDDYGSALVGTDTIDIYKPNLSMMRDWGVRHIDIEILEWGCYNTSYKILEGRKHAAAHTKAMYYCLKPKVGRVGS